jgi:hypothetical protein
MHLTYRDSERHKAHASCEVGAPENKTEVTTERRKALFPGLKVPAGLTFEDLEIAGAMALDWEFREDEFTDDFLGVRLAAKVYAYLQGPASARREVSSKSG